MNLSIEHLGKTYRADLTAVISLAIPLQFDGPQPNHFGTAKANRRVLRLGDFVGETEQGGSCNVDVLDLIPHCNGTHTETVSHIVNQDVWVGHSVPTVLHFTALATVPIRGADDVAETYRPALDSADQVITRRDLEVAFRPFLATRPQAIVIRTRPNPPQKRSRKYAEGPQPAFLTIEAMEFLDATECRHLLVDLPSVDRMYDDGKLTNHHLYWHVPEGSHQLAPDSRQDRTITEMVYVPDQVVDGNYLLNLQIPSFATDAAPSRPILLPLVQQ